MYVAENEYFIKEQPSTTVFYYMKRIISHLLKRIILVFTIGYKKNGSGPF
jgi:hypothetical protein